MGPRFALLGLVSFFAFTMATAHADPPSAETDPRGYSPELNAFFASTYMVPDDGKCMGYILDFEKKTRFKVGPQAEIAKSVVAVGEDDELSSCQLRSFDAQLEIKLKTAKTMTPEEKAKADYFSNNWRKPIEGFKDKAVNSFGQWLRKERPSYQPKLAEKLFELGYQEAEDGNWLDAYDALVIATELKPGIASKEARAVASKVVAKAEKESGAKALIIWEIVTRLDPKAAKPWLKLASSEGVAADRAVVLVQKALKIDPVLTTRSYREDQAFKTLRCDPKAAGARKKLPESLTEAVSC